MVAPKASKIAGILEGDVVVFPHYLLLRLSNRTYATLQAICLTMFGYNQPIHHSEMWELLDLGKMLNFHWHLLARCLERWFAKLFHWLCLRNKMRQLNPISLSGIIRHFLQPFCQCLIIVAIRKAHVLRPKKNLKLRLGVQILNGSCDSRSMDSTSHDMKLCKVTTHYQR